MKKRRKFATIEGRYIADMQMKVLIDWTGYLIHSKEGNEVAAACNITDARAILGALSFITMPCGRSALEVGMHDPRFMEAVDSILKDGSYRAYHQYKRVTK